MFTAVPLLMVALLPIPWATVVAAQFALSVQLPSPPVQVPSVAVVAVKLRVGVPPLRLESKCRVEPEPPFRARPS
jgi:hypothetical protein